MPHQIHVYGYTSGCPACTSLKDLLVSQGISYTFHGFDRGSTTRQLLQEAGFDTVPQIFDLEGNHLGDYGSTLKLFGRNPRG